MGDFEAKRRFCIPIGIRGGFPFCGDEVSVQPLFIATPRDEAHPGGEPVRPVGAGETAGCQPLFIAGDLNAKLRHGSGRRRERAAEFPWGRGIFR